jgi:hypothetical protein
MFLAFLLAAAAKLAPPDPRDAEIAALKAKVDDLKGERDRWQALAMSWRERCTRMDIAETRRLQAEMLASVPPGGVRQVDPSYFHHLQQMQANALHQQANAQMAQQNLLGAQGPAGFCNCVPARHEWLFGRVTQ